MKIVSCSLLMIVILSSSFLCGSSPNHNLQSKVEQYLEGVRQEEQKQIQQKQNQIQQRKEARTDLLLASAKDLDSVNDDRQKLKEVREKLRLLGWPGHPDNNDIANQLSNISERHQKKCCLCDCVDEGVIRYEAFYLKQAINDTLKREFERDQQSVQQQEGMPSAPCNPAYVVANAVPVYGESIGTAFRGLGEKLLPQDSRDEESSRQSSQDGLRKSSDEVVCVVS